jgi:N utilization substance protein A
VLSVTEKGERSAMAIVPDDKLSLAIGRDGQNARLAARLTGWKVDVKCASSPEAQKELAERMEETEEVETEETEQE